MIIVRITSGLGNQMYQYAFYRLMQELYGEDQVRADVTWFYANNDHHGYELERIFGSVAGSEFAIKKATAAQIFHATGLIPNICKGRLGKAFEKFRRYPNRILREFTGKSRTGNIIDYVDRKTTETDLFHLPQEHDWYLKGFFIEEQYYRDRLEQLRRELVFPPFAADENEVLADKIKKTNSVSIHVRRGDYLTTYESMFVALGREYYEKAVAYIESHVENPVYYIFSDDSDFVKEQFDWLPNKTIVTHNTGENSFRDMQLMSICKHNIIANSTFSQWGSLLNENKEHLTIYPAAYLRGEESEVKTLENWVRI